MDFPNKLLQGLDNELPSLMSQWNYNDNGPDWHSCGFCGVTADSVKNVEQPIIHDSDCLGVKLTESLKDKDFS